MPQREHALIHRPDHRRVGSLPRQLMTSLIHRDGRDPGHGKNALMLKYAGNTWNTGDLVIGLFTVTASTFPTGELHN